MKRFSGGIAIIAINARTARMNAAITTPHPRKLIARLPNAFCSHAPAMKLIAAPASGSATINRMKVTAIG